jgi:transcriptional regulator of acetoin/glycerol metabolism
VPRGARTAPLALEELRALRALADRLAAVIGVSAMLSRSRQREAEARAEADAQRARADEASRSLGAQTSRLTALARALERPARAAAYGPAARTAVEELERLAASTDASSPGGGSARAVTLLAAPGIDVAAWIALVHLASPRRGGVLVLVDGTDPAHHDLGRWREAEDSPLRVASGGTLGILDAHALPAGVQSWLAGATPDDTGLVISVPATVDSLVASGRFDERLADRIGDRAVALPVLANRGEDLRGLCIDHLARIGVRMHGQPMGIDTAALALLAEHAWPGNDVELEALLLRAARAATGSVIGVRELSAAGFAPVAPERAPERSARGGPIPITRRRRRT